MSECDTCSYYNFDDDTEEWGCEAGLDEDDAAHVMLTRHHHCPSWRSRDEYRMINHQSIGHLPGFSDDGRYEGFHHPMKKGKYKF